MAGLTAKVSTSIAGSNDSSSVISDINAFIGSGTLNSFDWKVSHVVSSARHSNVNETLLLLTLSVKNDDGVTKDISFELSLEELDAVLLHLTTAARSVGIPL